MKELLASFNRIFFVLCVVAFFINIALLAFAHFIVVPYAAAHELEMLSIINMILLSFVLLREPNQKT